VSACTLAAATPAWGRRYQVDDRAIRAHRAGLGFGRWLAVRQEEALVTVSPGDGVA
jgi:hypothetical protein